MIHNANAITFTITIITILSCIEALNVKQENGKDASEALRSDVSVHSHRRSKREVGDVWPGGVIPYIIDENSFDEILRTRIMKAMMTLELKVCLKFKRIDDVQSLEHSKWLLVTNRKGRQKCSHESTTADSGAQTVIFGYECMGFRNIAHQMLVMAGLPHEHNNPKRDDYVEILWDNIREDQKQNFKVASLWPFGEVEYDYGSITHFDRMAFTRNGGPTIKVKGSHRNIGQRTHLSEMDIEKVNILYKEECQNRDAEMKDKVCSVFYGDSNSRRYLNHSATSTEVSKAKTVAKKKKLLKKDSLNKIKKL